MLLDLLDDAEDTGGRLASLRAARHRRPQDPPLGIVDGDPLAAQRNNGQGGVRGAARLKGLDRAFAPAASRVRIASRRDQHGESRNGKTGGMRPPLPVLRIYATRRHALTNSTGPTPACSHVQFGT